MSGWGIAETAPEIEKIKAESADYLHGLNSCGEISWEVYDYAFDFYAELIQKAYELGKSEAEPHWIPVTQDTPTEDGDYWCTLDAETGRFGDWCSWYKGEWVVWIRELSYPVSNVIAWCKPMEPYKGVTE